LSATLSLERETDQAVRSLADENLERSGREETREIKYDEAKRPANDWSIKENF
jgi:hypothetical protein